MASFIIIFGKEQRIAIWKSEMLFFQFVVLLSNFWALFASPDAIVPSVTLKATGYQKWAHLQWVWLVNDAGNQENVTNFVNSWEANKIPIGAVNIDSTWATQFNNFEVDTTKFPDFPGLISDMHSRGYKVLLWATSFVNVENPDYEMAVDKGYLLRTARGEVRPIHWWHGDGGLLDYTNPDAVAWWHSKMDQVLDVGVDGFKCDGSDPFMIEYMLTGGAYGYQNQTVNYREYSSAYYRDFLYHTRERRSASGANGDAGLIMARPVDCYLGPTKGCLNFAPKDVMFSGWVGDDDADFRGMNGCLRKVIYSAWMGYGSMGCDIGGYRGNPDTKDRITFVRWAQLGAFLPLMENGGGGEHRPWMYDQEVVDIYRKFAIQHHRLATYLHNTGAVAVETGTSSIHPVDEHEIGEQYRDHFNIPFPQPKTYSYRLGDDIVVHPVVFEELNTTEIATVMMNFPAEKDGSSYNWLNWWEPNHMKKAFKSGQDHLMIVPFDKYPVFIREGAFIPLHDSHNEDEETETVNLDRYTFTWFHPQSTATKEAPAHYDLRESITTGTGIQAKAYFSTEDTVVATISSHPGSVALDLLGVERPTDVNIEAFLTSGCRQSYNVVDKRARVQCKNNIGGVRMTFSGVKLSQ